MPGVRIESVCINGALRGKAHDLLRGQIKFRNEGNYVS